MLILVLFSLGIFGVSGCPGGTTNPVIPKPSEGLLGQSVKRLIKFSEDEPARWLDAHQIEGIVNVHANFVDMTDHMDSPPARSSVNTFDKVIPRSVRFNSTVTPMTAMLSIPHMQNFIKNFTNFRTRFYFSVSGVNSQKWLLQQAQAAVVNYPGNATVREFSHLWPQKSIIARIEGTDETLKQEIVIMGAHQDSINKWFPVLNAPGADDNASGSAILLENLHVIAETGYLPKRTIEFHWYAAEEVGLRGSGDIAKSYSKAGKKVVSMLNFDVVGYNKGGMTDIAIYTDKTSPTLNAFLRVLVDNYCSWSWKDRKCGYGCSDHASWTRYGFPASMAAEYHWNPFMHTTSDHFRSVEFPQVLELSKLGIGYLVEMSA